MNTTYRLGIAAAAALAFTRAWAGADAPADASRSSASGDDTIAAFHDDAGVVPGGTGYKDDTGSTATTGDTGPSQDHMASLSPALNAPVGGGTASVAAPNPSDPEQQRIWSGP